jgi:DNA-binding MarR family transcriptional regulator
VPIKILPILQGKWIGKKMQMKETVRSGRRANFYITDNSFIDNYGREAGPFGIALYHVLERYMNCETRSTWVGTAKMADILNVSQRTVQRHLKTLEDLKLIRILRTETRTIYVVMPVPPRAKTPQTIPLFDAITEEDIFRVGDDSVAWATPESHKATTLSQVPPTVSRFSDTSVTPYKEEQNLSNKTYEQEPHSPRKSAERIIAMLGLPVTLSNLNMVEAAVVAEVNYTGISVQEAAKLITNAAIEDRNRGITINKFYFEDVKWRQEKRSNVRASKAEQRKLDNLEVNARAKQRLREKLGVL